MRVTGTGDIGTIVRGYDGPLFGFASRNFYASFLVALDVSNDYRRYFECVNHDNHALNYEILDNLTPDDVNFWRGQCIRKRRAGLASLPEAGVR